MTLRSNLEHDERSACQVINRAALPRLRSSLTVIGLALVALSFTSYAAAVAHGTSTSGASLTVTARVDLGPSSAIAIDQMPGAEAPDGTFYYAIGSVVRVVRGTSAPIRILTAAGPVLALAATTSDLYVQTGLTIDDYRVPAGEMRHSWTLPGQLLTPRTAGLFVAAGALWSWSDGATDQSGFEYATVDMISTATGAIRVVDQHAYPADMAADRSGLYYETEIGLHGYLAHVTPTGTRTFSHATSDVDSPLAIVSGSVVLFTERGNGTPYLDRYSATALGLLGSYRLTTPILTGVDTSEGLFAVACNESDCASRSVVRIASGGAAVMARITLVGLATLVEGASPAALTSAHGHGYLVRLV